MFECKFKYELEDSLVSAKYIYKSQKRKQDKIIALSVSPKPKILNISESAVPLPYNTICILISNWDNKSS